MSSGAFAKSGVNRHDDFIDSNDPDQFPMYDSFDMEELFSCFIYLEPSIDLYHNNPDMTAERRCRIVNWLLEVIS